MDGTTLEGSTRKSWSTDADGQWMLQAHVLRSAYPASWQPQPQASVQVRAFAGLTSRRCGILHPGEVIQIIETQMVNGVTRARFRGGWVTLVPGKPRTDSGSSSTAVSRQPLLEWTRAKPTKLSSFRDQVLLSTLADRGGKSDWLHSSESD